MNSSNDNLAAKLLARATEAGGDPLLEEAAILLSYILEAGQDCVVRPDSEGRNYGVIHTSADLIGTILRVYVTDVHVDPAAHVPQLGEATSVM